MKFIDNSLIQNYQFFLKADNSDAAKQFDWLSSKLLLHGGHVYESLIRNYARSQFLMNHASMPALSDSRAETARQILLKELRDELILEGQRLDCFGATKVRILLSQPFGEDLNKAVITVTAQGLISNYKKDGLQKKSNALKKSIENVLTVASTGDQNITSDSFETVRLATMLALGVNADNKVAQRLIQLVETRNKDIKKRFDISTSGQTISSPTGVLLSDNAFKFLANSQTIDQQYKQVILGYTDAKQSFKENSIIDERLIDLYLPNDQTEIGNYLRVGLMTLENPDTDPVSAKIVRSLLSNSSVKKLALMSSSNRLEILKESYGIPEESLEIFIQIIRSLDKAARSSENNFNYKQISEALQNKIKELTL